MAYIPPFLLFVDYRSIEIQATGRPGTSNSGYMTTTVSKICSDAGWMDGFITITDTKVVKFIVNTGTGKNYKKKTKWTKSDLW